MGVYKEGKAVLTTVTLFNEVMLGEKKKASPFFTFALL